MFTCVHLCSLVFTCVHLCSLVFTCVHLCSLVFTCVHLCSLVFTCVHLCSFVFTCVHWGSTCVLIVFICVPFVFVCLHLCSGLCGVLDWVVSQPLCRLLTTFSASVDLGELNPPFGCLCTLWHFPASIWLLLFRPVFLLCVFFF